MLQDINVIRKRTKLKQVIGLVELTDTLIFGAEKHILDSGKNMRPYVDLESSANTVIRRFGADIDPIELMWHRDDETRIVETVGETDWKIQLDNQLPTFMNVPIFIPKHMWHRAIKGTGNLRLKIHKS